MDKYIIENKQIISSFILKNSQSIKIHNFNDNGFFFGNSLPIYIKVEVMKDYYDLSRRTRYEYSKV